jgi:hypothetical protein
MRRLFIDTQPFENLRFGNSVLIPFMMLIIFVQHHFKFFPVDDLAASGGYAPCRRLVIIPVNQMVFLSGETFPDIE